MKKDKALKILKNYIGTGPQAEPVEFDFDKAIAAAIKYMEGKPYLAEDKEKRMIFELKLAREEEAGQFIVNVFLDDQLLHNIWCDHITVFASKPPTYCLKMGGKDVISLSGRLMLVHPDAVGVIPLTTRATLGEYVKVGTIEYENNHVKIKEFGAVKEA